MQAQEFRLPATDVEPEKLCDSAFRPQFLIRRVFEVRPRTWRGIGEIRASGLGLREEYRALDAEARFGVSMVGGGESPECISGLVLQGLRKPPECPAFGTRCTPDDPLGATMVSSEGACAAYHRYRRPREEVLS